MGALSFLQPAYLFALFAVAVPIIIHLIHRRRAVRWRFAAMEFLLRSQRRVERRLRLKQILLLLLRCLLLALLAFIFAKPFLKKARGTSPSTPRAIVLILDDSFSMQYTPKGKQSLFQQAKARATKLIKNLRGEDQIALLHGSKTNRTPKLEQNELTFDKQSTINKLDQWKVSYRETDLERALKRAEAILRKLKGFQPQIVLVSDFARHAFDAVKVNALKGLPPIELLPIRAPSPQNCAITQVKTAPASFASPDAYRFVVTVRNFSARRINSLPIQLFLNNRPRTRGTVKLAPFGTTEKTFVIQLPRTGQYVGYAQIGKDPLETDNKRYFTLYARQRPKVLVINGSPRTITYLDEVFYLERALRDPRSPFRVDVHLASSTLPPPSKYEAIFLANVERLPKTWIAQLHRFVRKGGGLFISMGDQTDAKTYNTLFHTLLPRPLRNAALAAQRPDGTGVAINRYFGEINGTHPVFRRLYRDGIVFQTARISKLMLVQTRKSKDTSNSLWRYSHGPPALLERKIGKGRVLLLTTTLDRDWTDLPIRPYFQPWLQEVTTYLAGGERFRQGKPLSIEQPTTLVIKGEKEPVKVKAPLGKSLWMRSSTNRYRFPGGDYPGVYRFSKGGKPLPNLPIAVNVSADESDIAPIPNDQLKNIGTLSLKASGYLNQESSRLWPTLLFFLCLIFFAEAAVLRFL